MRNTCVCCGVDIPEGMMVCPRCEEKRYIQSTISNKFTNKKEKTYANHSKNNKED